MSAACTAGLIIRVNRLPSAKLQSVAAGHEYDIGNSYSSSTECPQKFKSTDKKYRQPRRQR